MCGSHINLKELTNETTAYASEPAKDATPPKVEKKEEKKKSEMKLAKKKADLDKEKATKKAETLKK
jgi:hypothetical protein